MLMLYASIAMGGVILLMAPPRDVAESKALAHKVAFLLTWPCYLILDVWMKRRRSKG